MDFLQGASIVTAAATLLGALIGAMASIASTYWLHNKQRKEEEQRLRQALIAEVDSMQIDGLVRVAETFQDLGSRDERKEVIGGEVQRMFEKAGDEDSLESIPDELMDGILDRGAHQFAQAPANTLSELSTIDLSTNVYDANLDKIGRLDVPDIEQIIEYYKRVHKLQQTVDDIIQALETQEQETDVSQFGGRLKGQANGLSSQQEQVLDVLQGEEEHTFSDRLSGYFSEGYERSLTFVRNRTTQIDVLTLFLLPSIFLLGVFLYPESESLLEYKARNPTLLGIVGSSLAHRSWSHLAGNVLGLWLIGGTGYVLSRKAGRRNLYRASFVSYLVVLPFFANYFVQRMLTDQPEILSQLESVGFSIVVGSLAGLLTICLPMYLDWVADSDERVLSLSGGLFIGGFGIIFYQLGFPLGATVLTSIIGIVAFLYTLCRISVEIYELLWSFEYVWCIWGLVILVWSIIVLFNPPVGGGYFGHMAGYWGGFLIPIVGLLSQKGYKQIPADGALSGLRD